MPELNSKIEEAVQRLIPHIHYSISQGAKRSAVISNDIDVSALLIHYLPDFLGLGLKKLWIMFGVGDKTRFPLLHLSLYKIGVPKCKVIYKAHILTGSYSTSKIDSEKSAISANSKLYLQRFGEENELSVEVAERTEQYLIKVEQPKSTGVTFSELRFDVYWSRKTPYVKFPPSSHSLQRHLQRCFFIIRMVMNLLDNQFEIDPLEFGWIEVDGYIVLNKQLLPLPDFYLVCCGYTKKCIGRCSFAKQNVACTEFCKYKGKCPNFP